MSSGGVLASEAGDVALMRRRVLAVVRRTCPRWMADDAEDIAQDVLARLVCSPEDERHFSGDYLEKAVHGAIVDEIRRHCRRREDLVGGEEAWTNQASADAGPESRVAQLELEQAVHECLLGLRWARRLTVMLHLQGCTIPETAERLAWTPKKVENLLYRGLADLRGSLRARGLS